MIDKSWSRQDGVHVSLFAISNEENYKGVENEDLDALRRMKHYIAILPHMGAKEWWNGFHDIMLSGDKLFDRGFVDMLSWPRQGYSWTVPNAMWALSKSSISEYDQISPGWHALESWNHSDPLSWLWYFETNMLRYDESESMLSNQTWHVKFWTGVLREVLHHNKSSLHRIRAEAVKRAGGIPITDGTRVNGVYNAKPVTVAGHLVNLLLASHYVCIDFARWMKTISGNIHGRAPKTVFEDVEVHELWHSRDEWILAIDAYVLMAQGLSLDVRWDLVSWLKLELTELFVGNDHREGREIERLKRENYTEYMEYVLLGGRGGQHPTGYDAPR
jgi:hypothetical protein